MGSNTFLAGITAIISILTIFLCWLYLKLVIGRLKANKKLPPCDTLLSAVALISFAIGVVSIFTGVIKISSVGSGAGVIENILLRVIACFAIASVVFSIQVINIKKNK